MFSFFFELNNKKKFLFVFLTIIVFSFFTQTIFKGLQNSCDLMWQPTKLFWDGINHYEYQLKTKDIYLGCQKGQYGHFLFILLYPISLVGWGGAKFVWIIVNIIFALVTPILLCRYCNLSKLLTFLVLGIFLTSHPTRMTINYGQNSLMIFFFLSLPFLFNYKKYQNFTSILSGISYVKYSTGYILFLNFLVEKEYKKLILSLIITIFGWFFYSLYTKSNIIDSFFDPFQLILSDNYVRTGDLYSILNIYFLKEVTLINKIIQIGVILFINIFLLYQIKDISNQLAKLTIICFMPLIFLPHSNYDYVLMLPTLIFGIRYYNLKISKICLLIVIYYFYFHRIIRHLINNDMIYQSGMLILLSAFLMIFVNFAKQNKLTSQ